MRRKAAHVVSGFVVKLETVEVDPTTRAILKKRIEVSRTYHSRDAAQTLLDLLKKANPTHDYYIHEKSKRDDGGQIY